MIEETKQLTDGSTEEIRTRSGSTQIVTRGKGGMFQAKPVPLSTEEVQKALLTKITEVSADGSSVLETILNNQIESASTSAVQPRYDKFGNEIGTAVDSKLMGASAKAAQVVLKAAGLETPIKKVEQQNRVEIVNLTLPPEVLSVILERQGGIIKEYELKAPTTPAWAEVTEVTTNEPHTTATED